MTSGTHRICWRRERDKALGSSRAVPHEVLSSPDDSMNILYAAYRMPIPFFVCAEVTAVLFIYLTVGLFLYMFLFAGVIFLPKEKWSAYKSGIYPGVGVCAGRLPQEDLLSCSPNCYMPCFLSRGVFLVLEGEGRAEESKSPRQWVNHLHIRVCATCSHFSLCPRCVLRIWSQSVSAKRELKCLHCSLLSLYLMILSLWICGTKSFIVETPVNNFLYY